MLKNLRRLVLGIIFLSATAKAQTAGIFTVKGDLNKFYPVTFLDAGWNNNVATELQLGRSITHSDSTSSGSWQGSLIATFRYHTTNWGHGTSFIDADIRQEPQQSNTPFIAGWRDVTSLNGSVAIIIWLRGKTTYNYTGNYALNPTVYDGEQNPLPYNEVGVGSHTYKTAVDAYVNQQGISSAGAAYYNGAGNNYFAGNVGIGTTTPGTYKLVVEGIIGARRVKVNQDSWADFVFHPEYKLPPLQEVEAYIKANQHLPEIPSAAEVEKEGLDLGEMNKKLLQKVEELTLYLLQQDKKMQDMQQEINELKNKAK